MDTMIASARAAVANALGEKGYVFDWHKAARLIRDRKPREAGAGLRGDWEWTGGSIYRDGAPVPKDDTYTYLASVWCKAEIDLDGDVIECCIPRTGAPGEWDAGTYWPESALAILRGEAE